MNEEFKLHSHTPYLDLILYLPFEKLTNLFTSVLHFVDEEKIQLCPQQTSNFPHKLRRPREAH